jgi:hypothetical protein
MNLLILSLAKSLLSGTKYPEVCCGLLCFFGGEGEGEGTGDYRCWRICCIRVAAAALLFDNFD